MSLLRGKKEEKKDSVVLDKLDKSRQFTVKMFDFIFCAAIAVGVGYVYGRLSM